MIPDTTNNVVTSTTSKSEQRKTAKPKAGDACNYDLDSTSGRAKICKDVAAFFILGQMRNGHPIKGINGKLMKFNEGIYEDSDEERSFMKKEIKDIGMSFKIPMPTGLIDQTLKLVELDTLVRTDECEPDLEHVVVLNNGILDMRDWTFKDFNSDKIYFSKIPVDYIPDAPKPTIFLKYIDTCFAGNEEQKDLMQEALGYTLTKTYKYQDIFYMLGTGGNGKGSMISIIKMMLGEENCTSFSLFQLSDGNNVDYNIAMMKGKHVNLCGDVGKAKVVNTENIKKLSSNTDLVTGRHVRERPFQFINYAKMFFLFNRIPASDACTTGDRRRIRMINFNNSFSEKPNEIKDIHRVIKEAGELPGVLLWAIEGLKRLEKNQKFTDTRSISQRAIEYDRKSETMRYFVEEIAFEDPGAMLPREILLDRYTKFVKKTGGSQLGHKELKASFLEECKDAGWKGVYSKQDRIKTLGEDTEKVLRNDFKLTGEKTQIYYGVSLIEPEHQTTISKYVPYVPGKMIECKNDTEMYEIMMQGREEMSNNS